MQNRQSLDSSTRPLITFHFSPFCVSLRLPESGLYWQMERVEEKESRIVFPLPPLHVLSTLHHKRSPTYEEEDASLTLAAAVCQPAHVGLHRRSDRRYRRRRGRRGRLRHGRTLARLPDRQRRGRYPHTVSRERQD